MVDIFDTAVSDFYLDLKKESFTIKVKNIDTNSYRIKT